MLHKQLSETIQMEKGILKKLEYCHKITKMHTFSNK